GLHWVAFLMDLDKHTIEYYNSFGDDIPSDILVRLKNFLAVNNPTKQYLKLKVNRIVDQDANTSNCGWFCCKFIIDRFRGKPWRECTKFDDHVRGEEAIAKFKAQHGGSYNVYL
ncbi:MAG: Ulp1 family isopeptidase, partial [Candidatus Saccharimonadales bacterium]